MFENLQFLSRFKGLYSSHPLLSSQEIGYGGMSYGRAYDPAEITGDKGIMAALELRYTAIPKISALNTKFVPFAFYDIGKVWNNDTNTIPQSAASAGIGTYYRVNDHFSGTMQIAYPLTKSVSTPIMNGANQARILWTLNAQF